MPEVVSTETTWRVGDLVLEANVPTPVPADQLAALLQLQGVLQVQEAPLQVEVPPDPVPDPAPIPVTRPEED